MKPIKLAVFGIVAIMALAVFFSSVTSVPSGYVGVKTRFSAVTGDNLGDGPHLTLPFIESIHTINIQQQTFHATKLDAVTMPPDLQRVTTDIAVNFSVDPGKVSWVYSNYRTTEALLNKVMAPALEESVKSVTARYSADQLIGKRQEVKDGLLNVVRSKLKPFGIEVADLSMTQFQFSKSFTDAIEAKVVAEQSAQTAKNNLDRIRIEGEQRVTQAKAEADAIRVQAEAIEKQGGAAYVQLKAIEKWDGQLPTTMVPGGSTPFINLNK